MTALRTFLFPILLLSLMLVGGNLQAAVGVKLDSDLPPLENLRLENLLKGRAKQALDITTLGQLEWQGNKLKEFLQRHMQSAGYYRPEITVKAQVKPERQIRLKMAKGCHMRWRKVNIELVHADGVPEKRKKHGEVEPGKPLSHSEYEKAASDLLSDHHRQGFIYAKWLEKKVAVDPEACAADVRWKIALGKLAKIGEVTSSDSRLPGELVKRMSGLKTGEPLQPGRMAEARRNLVTTQWFQSVNLQLGEQEPTSGAIDIDVQYDLAKPNVYEWRAGYNTDRGPVLNLGWQRRYLEGSGHGLSADLEIAGAGQRIGAAYTIPRATEHEIAHYFTSNYEVEEVEGLETESTAIDWRWALRYGDWRLNPGIGWQREISETDATEQTAQTLLLKFDAIKQALDDPLWPKAGHSIEFSIRGGPQNPLNDQDVIRVALSAGYLYPIADNWSLQVRGRYGQVFADETGELPTNLRFFAGGDRSVRGYSYQELSPEDASNTPIGGKEVLTASIEPIWFFKPNWAAVLFYDIGAAYDEEPSTLPYGYGSGIRWRSPVGQIGLDIARAVHPDFSDWRIHFRLGTAL